jgi:DNA-binding IclR family transcriptional regulator
VAWGRGEYAEGISSVAAPVRDTRGKAIAALHVHGPSYRFPVPGEEQRAAATVRGAAAAIGRELALGS